MNASVSVIIPCYNQAEYLEEAIMSAKSQTYPDVQVTVVNDFSPDNTNEKVDEIKAKGIDFEYITLQRNIGATMARTIGVKSSDSEFILFLDADDKIAPTFIEKHVSVISRYDVAFSYCDTQLFGGSSGFWNQPEYNFFSLLNNNYISYCSLIKRTAFNKCGGYDIKNRNYFEDYQLWLNMGRQGLYGKHIPEKLFYYRIHPKSSTQSNRSYQFAPVYKAYIISKYPEIFPIEWIEKSRKMLEEYPINFMSLKPQEQEMYLK